MSGWWVALRLAWREVRRSRGRAALVVAMIAVPVLGLSYAAVSWDMFTLTTAEEVDRRLGGADAIVSWPYEGPIVQDHTGEPGAGPEPPRRERSYTTAQLLAVLPPGSRVLPDERSAVTLRTPAGGLAVVEARGLDLTDPLTHGIGSVVDGRAPAGSREVAMTAEAADALAVRVGDTVRSFDDTADWRVVGLVRFPETYGRIVAYRPGALPALPPTAPGDRQWLVDTPADLTWAQVQRLNTAGILADARSLRLQPPAVTSTDDAPADDGFTGDDAEAAGSVALLAGLGVLEVILLAGPAFAVGARTRRRELALIAANGGTPAHLRRVVLADGVVLGAAGATCGVALGIALAWFGRPISERYVFQAYAGGFRVFPAALLAICAAAVVTGVLAALVPAATAARQPVVAALTGRRGAVRSRRRWLVLGLAMVAVGSGVATVGAWRGSIGLILLGLTAGEVGLVLCTPSLLGLIGRLGQWLPLGARMSVRDTARNRSSAAPAISAVMAAVAGSVAVGVILAGDNARERAQYRPVLPHGTVAVGLDTPAGGAAASRDLVGQVEATVRATLRTERTVAFDRPACAPAGSELTCTIEPIVPPTHRCPYAPPQFDAELSSAQRRAANADPRCADVSAQYPLFPGAATTDGSVLAALTGASGAELTAASAVLAGGGVVTTDPRHVLDGRITLQARTLRGDGTPVAPSRSLTVPAYVLPSRVAALVVPPAVVRGTGLTTVPYAVLATPAVALDEAAGQRLDAALRDVTPGVYSTVEDGPFRGNDAELLLLAIAASLITLGAAGVATGLAAVDGRNDLATLGAIGASPRVRRLLSLSQAGVIAGVGTALGLAAGLGAGYTILAAMNQGQLAPDRWPREIPYPLTVPWPSLAVLLAVPAVAMLGAGLLTRSRLPIERRPG
jgi:putative ABC transport system permease protein